LIALASLELVVQIGGVPRFLVIHELLQRPGGMRHQQFRAPLPSALRRKWREITQTTDTGPTGFSQ
jgi:hypothetical protein